MLPYGKAAEGDRGSFADLVRYGFRRIIPSSKRPAGVFFNYFSQAYVVDLDAGSRWLKAV